MWQLVSGIFLGWTLGANDSANVFGTGVSTGTVSYRAAIWLTAGFVLLGAYLEGAKCMATLSELSTLGVGEAFLCTLAAGLTMAVLTVLALPASSSQAVVGAILGVGLLKGDADFTTLYRILICWVLTPVGALVIAYPLYRLLTAVLDRTITRLTHRNALYAGGIIVSGCCAAYSLGANNVANVTGIYVGAGLLDATQAAMVGGASIALGALTYSRRVMLTVGKGIVPLDPFSALVSVLAQALTLSLFTQIGVPVSSSQAVVGAVIGVGLVRDSRAVSLAMVTKIGFGWLFTPVMAGVLALGLMVAVGRLAAWPS